MKKYKLIKEYPGSPRLGSIHFWSEKEYTTGWLGEVIYDNNPEFWEKVKEYEILSRKLVPDWWAITSIKRLSDGEIFTVGDKIKAELFVIDRKFTVIDEIYYNEHKQLSYRTNSGKAPRTFIFDESTKHYKEPLFTTEDGVEIFKGDTPFLWKVTDDFDIVYDHYEITEGYKFFIKGRTFSTREAAKKWIDENKPKYSKKDIKNLINKASTMSDHYCYKKELLSYLDNDT